MNKPEALLIIWQVLNAFRTVAMNKSEFEDVKLLDEALAALENLK